MPLVAREKPKSSTSDDGSKKPISYRPSQAVHDALEDYRSRFEFKPDKSAILERALRAFLKSKGYKFPDDEDD